MVLPGLGVGRLAFLGLHVLVACALLLPARAVPALNIFLNDDELISVMEKSETTAVTETDVFLIEATFMRRRSLLLGASDQLVTYFSTRLMRQAERYRLSGELEQGDMVDQWKEFIVSLLETETNPAFAQKMHHYYSIDREPRMFLWLFGVDRMYYEFVKLGEALQADDMWSSHWHRVLSAGAMYLHGEVPVTVQLRSALPLHQRFADIREQPGYNLTFRADFVQNCYHQMVMKRAFGRTPLDFKQIVEFGGGTAIHSAILRHLNYEGVHFIFDIKPMLYLQQYFLAYSGWPSYMGDQLESESESARVPSEGAARGAKDILKGRDTILGKNYNTIQYKTIYAV
jgi:hypothetical protein